MNYRDQMIENMAYHLDSRTIAASVSPAYRIVSSGAIVLSHGVVDQILDDGEIEISDSNRKLFESLGAKSVWVPPPTGGWNDDVTEYSPYEEPIGYALAPIPGWVEMPYFSLKSLLKLEDYYGDEVYGPPAVDWSSVYSHCEDHLLSNPVRANLKYEVCDLCRGKGKVVNPNIDCQGITREDFDEDPDFEEDYLSGVYDIKCTQCKGERVVSVIDEIHCCKELKDLIESYENDQWQWAQESAYERAYGY